MINTFVIKACSIILDFIYGRYLRDYTYEMIIFQIVSSLNLYLVLQQLVAFT